MCLKFRRTANRKPLASLFPFDKEISNMGEMGEDRHTLRAIRIDHKRIPNINPLYWKCIWSTIMNPGCMNREAEIILCMPGFVDPRTNL